MAHVHFELEFFFDAPASEVWDELVDWKGHEEWIPSTHVDIHTATSGHEPGTQFTAWTGLLPTTSIGQRLSLEDRMEVESGNFDAATNSGECRVNKLGPLLSGWAGFTVEELSGSTTTRTRMHWVEDIQVRYAPQVVAPIMALVGRTGFKVAMASLAKQMAERSA